MRWSVEKLKNPKYSCTSRIGLSAVGGQYYTRFALSLINNVTKVSADG